MDAPAGHFAGLGHGFEEEPPVVIVAKDEFAPVSPRHHVIERAGVLDSNAPRHRALLSADQRRVKAFLLFFAP
jgi:hypothetical protein